MKKLILFILFLFIIANVQNINAQVGEPVQIDGYVFTLTDQSNDYENCRSTWTYTVSGNSTSQYDLSHWTLELCPDHLVISATEDPWMVGPDPTTGIYGIKWEGGLGVSATKTYTFILAGVYNITTVRAVGFKADGLVFTGLIAGPDCVDQCNAPQKSSLGDKVWVDLNKNGIQENGEPGMSGVTVELYFCEGHQLLTTVTDVNGEYLFSNLINGSYQVKFILPQDYQFTTKDQGLDDALDSDADPVSGLTVCLDLQGGQNITTVDAGIYLKPASLGDFVWNDANQNGIQEDGEPGIPNVTVELRLCSDHNVLVATDVTDANGYYSFTDLTPGVEYFIKITPPAEYPSISPVNQGGDDAKDSDIGQDGQSGCITLAPGENNITVDAGLFTPPPLPASIGDFVWNDTDKDGLQDSGEPGLLGVIVNLWNCTTNTIISTTLSDNNGFYTFTNLQPGSYAVEFVKPLGFTISPALQGGNPGLDSDPDPATGKTPCLTLAAGDNNMTIDAGMYETPPVPANLGDFVWNDLDQDGIQDANEPGILNVTVNLRDCETNALIGTTLTDANGAYSFTNLAPGNYYVEFVKPSGYVFSPALQGGNTATDSDADATGRTSCLTLASGQTINTIDAGMFQSACLLSSVGDFVWNDLNNNGIQDSGEPGLGNITVELHKCLDNSLVATTVTTAGGYYTFANLIPGDYYIQFVLPAGATVSPAFQGGNITLDSNPDATGKTACFTLGSGQNITTIDAGINITTPNTADLKLEKSVTNTNPACGEAITFTIKVTNLGPLDATGVIVSDLLPGGLYYNASTPSQGTYNSATGEWNVGSLASGAFATLGISAAAAFPANSFVVNTACISHSDVNDPNPSNNCASVTLGGGGGQVCTPLVPILSWPTGNPTMYINPPSLYWYVNGFGTFTYQIQIVPAGQPWPDTYYTSTGTSFTVPTALLPGVQYMWRVRSDCGTSSSEWSSIAYFTMVGEQVTPGVSCIPVPTWPVGNATEYINPPSLIWYMTHYVAGLTYEIQIVPASEEWPADDQYYTSPGLIFTMPYTLTPGVQYKWRVRASCGIQKSDWSPPAYFTMAGNGSCVCGPVVPVPLSPTGNASICQNPPVLSWTLPNYVPGLTYEIQFVPASDAWPADNSYFTSNTLTFTIPAALTPGVQYKWRVRSTDGTTKSAWSSEALFTLSATCDQIPVVPIPQWPVYYATICDAHPTLNWSTPNCVSGLTYEIQLVQGTEAWPPDNVFFTSTTQSFVWPEALLPGVGYKWRVRSVNGGVKSPWSNPAYFVMASNNLAVQPMPGSPADFAQINSAELQLFWYIPTASTGITTYEIMFADNPEFISAKTLNSVENNVIVAGLQGGKEYFWKVRSKDVEGNVSPYSAISKFKVDESVVTEVEKEVIPTDFELSQNYPNPFNPSTVIQFAIPAAGNYTLKVYDMLGEEVAVLVDGEVSVGIHKVSFDAADLTTGTYLYRLSGNNVNLSKKMLLIK